MSRCTFPYAPDSAPNFNARAYVTLCDGGAGKPEYYAVWSPVHQPHRVGHYRTSEAAQARADQINAMGTPIYGLPEWKSS